MYKLVNFYCTDGLKRLFSFKIVKEIFRLSISLEKRLFPQSFVYIIATITTNKQLYIPFHKICFYLFKALTTY